MKPVIDIAIESEAWEAFEEPGRLAERVIGQSVSQSGVRIADGAEVSIVLCDDAFIAELNAKWRRLDKPTNVLSFPSGGAVASTPAARRHRDRLRDRARKRPRRRTSRCAIMSRI